MDTWIEHYCGDHSCKVCGMTHDNWQHTRPPQHAACAAIAAAGCTRQRLGADWCVTAWHVAGNVYVCDAEGTDEDGLPLFEIVKRTWDDGGDDCEVLLTTSDGDTLRAALARLAG